MNATVLVHGWGMGPEIWSPLDKILTGYAPQKADLGFRGTPAKPEAKSPLVITHSLGLMWALAHLPRPWSGLVVINGFTRFSRTESFPGVEPRVLGRMSARLAQDPAGIVAEFLHRCGMASPRLDGLDPTRLAEGLDWLSNWDYRPYFAQLDCPILALAGSADPIVSPLHSQTCFAGKALHMVDGAGHLLPHTHGPWLASRIAAVLKGDWSA